MTSPRSPRALRVALVGDRDDAKTAHQAIPRALALAAESMALALAPEWIGSDAVPADDAARVLSPFDAVWCVPGSPYRSMDGVLAAIRHARTRGVPFLGTCAGFQHLVVEYARDVLGWADAFHAESPPEGGEGRAVIAPLACALVEARETLALRAGTRVAAAYGTDTIEEGYRCRFGLADDFVDALASGPLRAAAHGPDGSVRAVELDGPAFLVATLFQPERAALDGRVPPLVRAWLQAAADVAA